MMLKPSIDSLLESVNSKYSLVLLASKRAHELDEGANPTLDQFDSVKNVGKALEEIDAQTVVNDPNPELKRARLQMQEEEKQAQKEQEQKDLEDRIREDNRS
ncbi:DNA-directed RNA polymerase subunit omega [Tetragenococcus koreensis]|uniref:DNA-directed RNA polymerase subunit omega n=1 Tax=Tetragenococcus koreensis TaxID=290335 RepID=A0AAN4UA55_9ENTE|nr:DNA-directed RNA polymerase subunit omega [Tetragenococcus koreensis]MDN5832083.1 DNA-directed RNA polymerase subunit omega [Tetragenococcus halophilus]AYW46271.1 DNA-directed RNA polymerase subunit omega [Tetragenococcus koreensis]MCF1585025.1 DNA-directed RNA polymerase subunit omega [Tetragenococcus koreensis]MCF1614588.1 DNA-directed RNA polymerase subunit omega [Tetragenococcus koreensis]MCF1617135.1 DNA-directed RNA polymerase subunit omega [Tetragenococcus koreensis]